MRKGLPLLLAICLLFPAVAHATEYKWVYNPDTGMYRYTPIGEDPATTPIPERPPEGTANPGGGSTGDKVSVTDVPGNYKKGSVYGPKLSTSELKQVKEAVIKAVNACIREGMSEKQKIVALTNYLCDKVSFADDWSKNRANTAWGALIYGEAQCSGYTRAMMALLDAVGIENKYVHASGKAINPSHQWLVLKYSDGNWYHLDPQLVDDYQRIVNGVVTHPRPIVLMSSHMPYETKGIPKTGSKNITLQ